MVIIVQIGFPDENTVQYSCHGLEYGSHLMRIWLPPDDNMVAPDENGFPVDNSIALDENMVLNI
jgi:hypothetical protein